MALVPNNPGGAIPAMVLKANTGNVGIGTLNPSISKVEIAAQDGHGLFSRSETGIGVLGRSVSEHGVFGQSQSSRGVGGSSVTDIGVFGFSARGVGVRGESERGIGVFGKGLDAAGQFEGNVRVIGGQLSAVSDELHGAAVVAIINAIHGDIIVGSTTELGTVFQVRHNGDVQVRGVTLNCDKNVKANFSNVNTRQILDRLSSMPIAEWSYKADPTSVHHIGPTSQDFKLAFGLNGDEDERISVVDAQGIALAAIQGLNEKLNAENTQLRANLVSLETRLAALESNLRTADINAGNKGNCPPPAVTLQIG
jgi:hypothetical protein